MLRDDTSSLCQTIATFYMLSCQKKAVLIKNKISHHEDKNEDLHYHHVSEKGCRSKGLSHRRWSLITSLILAVAEIVFQRSFSCTIEDALR